MCCCQFTVDNQWYRARVVNVLSPSNPTRYPTLENGLCVEVTYIDYGNNEWIPVSRCVAPCCVSVAIVLLVFLVMLMAILKDLSEMMASDG